MATPQPRLTVPGLRVPEAWKKPDTVDGVRPYQIIDAVFALMRQRCIVAEYPGAGKKLIAVMAALKAFDLMKAQSFLVISLGGDVDQWCEDLEMLTDGCFVQNYRGSVKDRRFMRSGSLPDFRVTSYQTAAADCEHLFGVHQGIILDEVSYIKNPETDVHAHMRALCAPSIVEATTHLRRIWEHNEQKKWQKNSRHRIRPFPPFAPNGQPATYVWGLSATPYETSPMDVFSLYWAIQGSHSVLGTSARRFKYTNCRISSFTMHTHVVRGGKKKRVRLAVEKVQGLLPERKDWVRSQIKEWYIRHPWEVVSPYLPPIEIIPLILEMGSRQRERYQEISEGRVICDYVLMERGKRIFEKQVNYAIKQFYQLRCCDGLDSLPSQDYRDSVKRTETMRLLTSELGGEKVLLFSRFHQPLDSLALELDKEGILWQRIDGTRSEEENTKARRDFVSSEHPQVMLMTSKASYALNLQVARYGIAYNTLFNPKKMEQLYGRNRRPGIDNVVWYHLLCNHTVEFAQWEILREREQEFKDLFGGNEELFRLLDEDEQRRLVEYGYGSSNLALR